VQQGRAARIELVVLEHGMMRGLLPFEHHVEDRVHAVIPAERAT
jgi:hypothetical protein